MVKNQTPSINKRPIAVGGPNHTIYVPNDSILIDFRNSADLDGHINTFSLRQAVGPAPSTIENHPSVPGIFRVNKLIAGSYEFVLQVTDDKGATAYDEIQVEVIQGPPSGTEYVLDSLVWYFDWDYGGHTLQTPTRPDIFPPNFSPPDLIKFPADIFLRYDTATLWTKIPSPDSYKFTDKMFIYFEKSKAHVYDMTYRNLDGRKASLRIKFH